MFEIIQQTFYFALEVMQKGIYYLPFIFTIFIVNYLKENFYGGMWNIDKVKSLITLILSGILNAIFVLINYMIFVSLKTLEFNTWIYILNILGNWAISSFTVDMVGSLQKFLQKKLDNNEDI